MSKKAEEIRMQEFGGGYPQGYPPPDPVSYDGHKNRRSIFDDDLPGFYWAKYILFVYNMVIFLCGCVLLGIGIWMAVDRSFMTYIIGTDLYAAAIYIVLACGGIIFLVSFLGCCGAITENKCMLIMFMGFLCFVTLVLLIGGIIAIVFSTEIGESVRESMEDTLKNHYGVDYHDEFNRAVTSAWDRAQEKLFCCAVSREGWDVYKNSKWYSLYGATYEQTGKRQGYEEQKPYVPRSCCVKDRFWRYVNADVCQKWRLGPPGSPVDGAINRALYYEGCFDAGVSYLTENSHILIGVGIGFAVLLVGGIVLSFMMLRKL